jgi:branched-subunit amino acid transport protein
VLSALTISLIAGGEGIGGVDVEEVAGVAAGVIVAALTRNLIVSLAAGMSTLWVLLWLL